MPVARLVDPIAIAALTGLGVALVAFWTIAQGQRRTARQRILRFVGHRILRPAPWQSRIWDPRPSLRVLQGFLSVIFSSQSAIQTVLRIVILGSLAVGMVSGSATAFSVGAVTTLLLLAFASRSAPQDRIERQMPMALRLMVSGLRAGLSVPQTLALVAKDSPEPTASEFARARQEVDLGLGLDAVLRRLSDRTTKDYALVSTMVSVQSEVGGNLVQILEGLEETLRERTELRQHVAALTAQQRLSTLILTGLPIIVFLYTLSINSSYLAPVLESITGRLSILLAAVLLFVGWASIRWLGRVEE